MIGLLKGEAVAVCAHVCAGVCGGGRGGRKTVKPSKTPSDSGMALLTSTLKTSCKFVTTEKSQ